jgi:hypothetical protein
MKHGPEEVRSFDVVANERRVGRGHILYLEPHHTHRIYLTLYPIGRCQSNDFPYSFASIGCTASWYERPGP